MEAMEAGRVRERPGLDLAGTARAKTVYAAGGAVEAEVTRGDWSHVEWRACGRACRRGSLRGLRFQHLKIAAERFMELKERLCDLGVAL